LDYVQFCGSINPVTALAPQERISAENYAKLRSGINPFTGTVSSKANHILVDTREKVQFELCHIDGSVNIPFSTISATPKPALDPNMPSSSTDNQDWNMETDENDWVAKLKQSEKPVFVVCRLGNDSQLTVRKMKELGLDYGGKRFIGDIRGGLQAWRKSVDTNFPEY
jgi:adenylyltransferase/sulfurtransferase